MIVVSVAGELISDPEARIGTKSHKAAREVFQVGAVPGAIELLKPYVAPVKAEPLREEGDAFEVERTERPSLVLMLGEFDAWNQALESGNLKLGMRDLLGGLASHASDIRKAGATSEEMTERLERFLSVMGKKEGFSGTDLRWLETEAEVQRTLTDAKH